MKNFLIFVLLAVIAIVFFGQRYSFKAGDDKNGNYRIIMVNKGSGAITNLWGK